MIESAGYKGIDIKTLLWVRHRISFLIFIELVSSTHLKIDVHKTSLLGK